MPAKITFRHPAEKFIADNIALKTEIESALDEVAQNPYVDGKTKFIYPCPPLVATLYKKNSLWILYRPDNTCSQIDVWSIGKQGDKVSFR